MCSAGMCKWVASRARKSSFARPLAGQLRAQPMFAQFAAAQAQPEKRPHEFHLAHFGLEAVGVAVGLAGADDILRAHRRPHRRARRVAFGRTSEPRRPNLNLAVATSVAGNKFIAPMNSATNRLKRAGDKSPAAYRSARCGRRA
jgi:hypothetical protein